MRVLLCESYACMRMARRPRLGPRGHPRRRFLDGHANSAIWRLRPLARGAVSCELRRCIRTAPTAQQTQLEAQRLESAGFIRLLAEPSLKLLKATPDGPRNR